MKVQLTIYVANINQRIEDSIAQLREVLEANFPDDYALDIVSVLEMPEKAVENDIYVTPTLVRELPEPVLRVLGDFTQFKNALTSLKIEDGEVSTVII